MPHSIVVRPVRIPFENLKYVGKKTYGLGTRSVFKVLLCEYEYCEIALPGEVSTEIEFLQKGQ